MFKIQFIPILPFAALFLAILFRGFSDSENSFARKLGNKISILFAILFIVGGSDLRNLRGEFTFKLMSLPSNFDLSLVFHSSQTMLIMLLGIFWLFLALYSSQYFIATNDPRKSRFGLYLLANIGFLSGIIFSKNLLTAMFSFQLLALSLFFALKHFSSPKNVKSTQNFGFFVLASSSLMFLVIALTFKIIGQIDFVFGGIFDDKIPVEDFCALLFFLTISILSIAFAPFYLFFGKLHLSNPPTIILILVGFGFAVLALLFKIIIGIFGIKLFASFFDQINYYHFITIILGLNLLLSIIFALWSSSLKQILTLLFYNQLVLVILAFLTLGLGYKQMQIVISSFVLGQILIFICAGNIHFYLNKSGAKSLTGIVHNLPLTSLAFIFASLGFCAIVPAIGMLEKYYYFKNIWQNGLWIVGLILMANIALCLLCGLKIILPMLQSERRNNNSDLQIIAKNEGRKIECNFSFILPVLAITLTMVIFSLPFINNLFIK